MSERILDHINEAPPRFEEPEPPGESASIEAEPPVDLEAENLPALQKLRIYSHSSLLYWWPVWVVGYVMALVTYAEGHGYQVGQSPTWIHPSSNLGLIFFVTLILVIVITNFSVRGMASGMVIMGIVLLTVLLAFVGWWDEVFRWFGGLEIHLDLGAYFWFSTMMLVLWAVTLFGLDRLSYWEVTPGQLTYKTHLGGGSKSYTAQGMGLEKYRDDLFRHWLLGLGSGDLQILTSGATRQQIDVRNVLFVSSKVKAMQALVAAVPEGNAESS